MGNCCISKSLDSEEQIALNEVKRFTLAELRQATHSFNEIVGRGGFGIVYKGWVDGYSLAPLATKSGMEIAVKKFIRNNPEGQGARDWLTERTNLAQLRHPNIIRLVGLCCDGGEHMLVYKYMTNRSMEKLLFADYGRLHWQLRFRALLGAAKGLAYLHNQTPKIIYRDFKPSNILLDQDYNGVLADFGIARHGPMGDKSHVSTTATGSFGYICPCYIDTNHLTTKADVYSFGVVLLEVLSGRATVDSSRSPREHMLIRWALPEIEGGTFPHGFLDIEIQNCPMNTLVCLRELAARCLNYHPVNRPSMDEVVLELQSVTGVV